MDCFVTSFLAMTGLGVFARSKATNHACPRASAKTDFGRHREEAKDLANRRKTCHRERSDAIQAMTGETGLLRHCAPRKDGVWVCSLGARRQTMPIRRPLFLLSSRA
jgi:hypothetical protein